MSLLQQEEPATTVSALNLRTASLFVIAAGVTVFLLHYMQSLFAPLAFGLLLFYALDPVVDGLERVHVPRFIGAAVVIAVTFGTIGAGAYLLQDDAMTVINELPAGARRITAALGRDRRAGPGPLDRVEQAAAELQKNDKTKPAPGVLRVQVEEPRITASSLLWSGSIGAIAALNELIAIMFSHCLLLSERCSSASSWSSGPELSRRSPSRSSTGSDRKSAGS
jgi:predicted PurR-regulated permease PerM